MAEFDISAEIEAVKTAYEGRAVRQAFINALEAVQKKMNSYEPQGLIWGSDSAVSTGEKYLQIKLSLPFTPTAKTKVIASLRMLSVPTPMQNICMTIREYSNEMYANLVMGNNDSGENLYAIPNGTYYIDWIVIDKGVD